VDLPQDLPLGWHLAAWLALAPVLAWAVRRAPWRRLGANEQSHVFLGAVVAITLLWAIGGRVGPGVHIHLLGATILYLMFGLPLAIVGMTLVAAAATVAGGGEWLALAGRALLAGALPVLASHLVLRAAEARLPANLFVYVFVAAFFGGALAMLGEAASAAAVAALTQPAGAPAADTWTAMALMLAFGEATLSGTLVTLFVVYKPAWVGTFSDERYLKRGRA
jgi:uncharacterized membrane protein